MPDAQQSSRSKSQQQHSSRTVAHSRRHIRQPDDPGTCEPPPDAASVDRQHRSDAQGIYEQHNAQLQPPDDTQLQRQQLRKQRSGRRHDSIADGASSRHGTAAQAANRSSRRDENLSDTHTVEAAQAPQPETSASAAGSKRGSCSTRGTRGELEDHSQRPGTSAAAADSRHASRSARSTSEAPQPNVSGAPRSKSGARVRTQPNGGGRSKEAPQSEDSSRPRALLCCCKGETHSHREGFRRLARRLHDAGAWSPIFKGAPPC